jgi:hypothetical protein
VPERNAKMENTYQQEWLSVPVKAIHVHVILMLSSVASTGDMRKATLDSIKEASKLAHRAGHYQADDFESFWKQDGVRSRSQDGR